MSQTVLCAAERTEKANKVRKMGFIPGVVYGKDLESTSIKLDQREFNRVLQGHTKNSRVQLRLGEREWTCIVKDIQKDPINGNILHVDMQTIHSDDKIRLKVPVIFHGKEKLALKRQLLQEFISEVEIMGKAADIPEFVSVDVGDREIGDKITVGDLKLGENIRIMEDSNEILAVITSAKSESEEEESGENAEKAESAESAAS